MAVEVQGARFSYGANGWALEIDRLRLGSERMTCIVGPNGSGKSTLLRLAAGVLAPVAGTVLLDGRPLAGTARRVIARRVGFLPQESPPLFDYSVEMVARMGRYAHVTWTGALAASDRRAVQDSLAAVDMEPLRHRSLSQISGGERRRALIASVLAQEPGMLLLDEPTAALDIHHAVAVMRLLARLAAAGRAAVVIVTHDLNLAALFGDRLILVAGGRIFADGAPADVIREDTIRESYGEDILVRAHPETGGPMVIPRRQLDPTGRVRHG